MPIEVTTNHRYALDIPAVTVLIRATAEKADELRNKGVRARIDLSERAKGKYRESVEVALPPDVKLVRIIPPTVNVMLY